MMETTVTLDIIERCPMEAFGIFPRPMTYILATTPYLVNKSGMILRRSYVLN